VRVLEIIQLTLPDGKSGRLPTPAELDPVAQPLQELFESGVRAQVGEEGHSGNGDSAVAPFHCFVEKLEGPVLVTEAGMNDRPMEGSDVLGLGALLELVEAGARVAPSARPPLSPSEPSQVERRPARQRRRFGEGVDGLVVLAEPRVEPFGISPSCGFGEAFRAQSRAGGHRL